MGAGYHGGFGNTKGSKDKTSQEFVSQLKQNGIKFSEKDIIFITKDRTGQVVWLEKGNQDAGLEHIIKRHEKDYINVYNINRVNIPNFIKDVLKYGNLINQKVTVRKEKSGVERIYEYNDNYYTIMALGTNGFIISMYPVNKR